VSTSAERVSDGRTPGERTGPDHRQEGTALHERKCETADK
jgi:hypothetical protein